MADAAEVAISQPRDLPIGPIGRHGIGYWGVGMLVVSEAALFAYLLFAYYYTGASAQHGWVLEPRPSLKLALPNTILLLASSLVAWIGERGILDRQRGKALLGFGLAFIMGAVFASVQGYEWVSKPYSLGTSSYASLYFVTTGFHMAHVIIGLGVLAALSSVDRVGLLPAPRRPPGPSRPACFIGILSTSCGCSYSQLTT